MWSQRNIYDVARNGSINDVMVLMKINKDTINMPNEMGYLPLTLACYSGNDEVAIYLIDKTNNLDFNSSYGTALAAAVFKNRVEVAEKLLIAGANPNLGDSNGTTPLHFAVMSQNEKLVALLIKNKADKFKMDKKGKSPLDYALMLKNKNIIDIFE
jgi:ankyrin repeat protein